jgi:hypothetical protein
MTSVKSLNLSVEPFDGRGDFTLWQQRVKSILTREGTIKALKVKTRRTEIMTDTEWAGHRRKDKPEKLTDEEWEDLKDMATSTISLCLANNTLREVIGLTDPVDIWEKLESRYKSKSLTSRLYLKKRLFGLQMAEEANFNGHLDEFNKMTTELESIDVKIEEEDKALLLLASLPSSFDNIVTTLLFGKETLKFDEVVAALLMNETRRSSNGFPNEGQVLVAKEGGRGRGRSKQSGEVSQRSNSSGRKFRCYYCDEEGHLKRNCPKRKKDMKDENPVTAVAEDSSHASDGDLFLATTESLGKSDWILDSGCSFHMCSVKQLFDTYQACDMGTVKMANGARSKIVGVGTVRFRMFDGMVRTLTGVKHVPDLKGNLISLGTLDLKGYRNLAQGGVLKVSKGAMVVAKGKMCRGLYRLVGKVLIGEAVAEKATSDSSGTLAWKRRGVTFASSDDCGGDLGRSSEVELCRY